MVFGKSVDKSVGKGESVGEIGEFVENFCGGWVWRGNLLGNLGWGSVGCLGLERCMVGCEL